MGKYYRNSYLRYRKIKYRLKREVDRKIINIEGGGRPKNKI